MDLVYCISGWGSFGDVSIVVCYGTVYEPTSTSLEIGEILRQPTRESGRAERERASARSARRPQRAQAPRGVVLVGVST